MTHTAHYSTDLEKSHGGDPVKAFYDPYNIPILETLQFRFCW